MVLVLSLSDVVSKILKEESIKMLPVISNDAVHYGELE
jgi:hypothetical protein